MRFSLDRNEISEAGGRELLSAIKLNTSLTSLDVRYTKIPRSIIADIEYQGNTNNYGSREHYNNTALNVMLVRQCEESFFAYFPRDLVCYILFMIKCTVPGLKRDDIGARWRSQRKEIVEYPDIKSFQVFKSYDFANEHISPWIRKVAKVENIKVDVSALIENKIAYCS